MVRLGEGGQQIERIDTEKVGETVGRFGSIVWNVGEDTAACRKVFCSQSVGMWVKRQQPVRRFGSIGWNVGEETAARRKFFVFPSVGR